MLNYIVKHGLKILIGVKVVVIVMVLLANKGFFIGDKALFAMEEETLEENNENVKEQAAKVAQGMPEAPPPMLPEEEEDEDAPRRSYLEDLLNLPEIKTDGMQKEEISRYLTLLEKKKSQVEARIAVLSEREAHLKGLERSIDNKLAKLEEEMNYYQQTVQKEKEIKEERLARLVEFYKKMPAKKAAPVFEGMDKDLVVALFNRIPDKQTTQILSTMNAQKSIELSEYYGRIRSGSEFDALKEINQSLRKEFDECRGLPADVE
jgi:flagellar motility protein MotE (MotC chaperone)